MTGDVSENDVSTHEPGEVVESAISAIAAADDADTVVAATAGALDGLLGTPVACAIYAADGELVVATGDRGPEIDLDAVDLPDSPPDDELAWPADPLLVPVTDTGWLVCRTDGTATAPSWAVRSIAGVAVDAARGRVRRADDERRIAQLEAETDQLGNFANIVAHDLRNPLAIAQGHLELARESDGDEHFEKIADAHDRIQRIIDHTLTMAKQDGDGVEVEHVDTGTVAHDAWGTVETGAATLTVSDSMRVVADRERLQQLFENLFRNSVEHGVPEQHVEPSGGDEATVGRSLAVEVGTLSDGTGFFIADNGPGIPDGERGAVFDRGYSEGSGTGLGLSIIEDIVGEHDWSVAVTEGSLGGARFEISDVE
jgi:signal transduction histidine kinase